MREKCANRGTCAQRARRQSNSFTNFPFFLAKIGWKGLKKWNNLGTIDMGESPVNSN